MNLSKGQVTAEADLLAACRSGNESRVKALLALASLDVNAATKQGLTGLYIACLNGHFKVVQLLVEDPRTDIEQANDEGVTPLEVAWVESNNEIARFVKKTRKFFS